MSRRRLALVSCRELLDPALSSTPAALAGGDERFLLASLAARGVAVDVLAWDAAAVDWRAYDLVLVRLTWDYSRSAGTAARFAAWLRRLRGEGVRVLNDPRLLEWNADKAYLRALASRGVPTIPTDWLPARARAPDLAALLAARGWPGLIIKPCVSGGSRDTLRLRAGEGAAACARATRFLADMLATGADSAPAADAAGAAAVVGAAAFDAAAAPPGDAPAACDMMLQPYLPAVESDGELSVVVLDGRVTHAVRKRPRAGDFRVQEEFDAAHEAAEIDDATRALALRVVAAALAAATDEAVGPGEPPLAPPLVARVDFLRDERGGLLVLELELIEPCLMFGIDASSQRAASAAGAGSVPAAGAAGGSSGITSPAADWLAAAIERLLGEAEG